jgi:hypothetical protein
MLLTYTVFLPCSPTCHGHDGNGKAPILKLQRWHRRSQPTWDTAKKAAAREPLVIAVMLSA